MRAISDGRVESRVQTVFRISQVLVFLAVIAGANRMIGQEKPASLPRPLYPLPCYEEEWSLLSDPAKRDDFWDPIKFIPLNEDRNIFLSLGWGDPRDLRALSQYEFRSQPR